MLLSLLDMSCRDRMRSGRFHWKVKCFSAATQLKTAEMQPPNTAFLLYISAMVNSHVPLPVCSGVGLCAVSHLLKAYLGNRPLRLALTCGRSRFRLRSTLPLCCKSGEMPVHYRHNWILTGMFDGFSPASFFCQGGDRYLKSEVSLWLHSYPGCSLFLKGANETTPNE